MAKFEIKFGNAKHPCAARKVTPQNGSPFCTMAFDVVDKETGYLVREGSLDLNEQATKITGVRIKTGNWEPIPNTEDFRRVSTRIPLSPKSGRIDFELDNSGNMVEAKDDEKVGINDPIIAAVVLKAQAIPTIETYVSDWVNKTETDETAHPSGDEKDAADANTTGTTGDVPFQITGADGSKPKAENEGYQPKAKTKAPKK